MKVKAVVQRSGDWWAIEVPEVDGAFTQAKRLDQVAEMAAEAVGLLEDVDPSTVEVEWVVSLAESDADLVRYVNQARKAQDAALVAGHRAALASRAAVAALRQAELSTRDAALLLGVSHQRVSQLAKDLQEVDPAVVLAQLERDDRAKPPTPAEVRRPAVTRAPTKRPAAKRMKKAATGQYSMKRAAAKAPAPPRKEAAG